MGANQGSTGWPRSPAPPSPLPSAPSRCAGAGDFSEDEEVSAPAIAAPETPAGPMSGMSGVSGLSGDMLVRRAHPCGSCRLAKSLQAGQLTGVLGARTSVWGWAPSRSTRRERARRPWKIARPPRWTVPRWWRLRQHPRMRPPTCNPIDRLWPLVRGIAGPPWGTARDAPAPACA